ncbi:MAG TPA: sulfotransferase family 2 domain-containing protein [Wenzhouxiangellaceae bacterium]|nr:sulfotransferase family 2 domain-containing protein [Wenzhouxiangellaceae bacterium]
MIISHRHRFIFMHCRKAAGSSIAASLAPHLGPADIHLGTWPEAFEQGVPPNRRAWRDLLHPLAGFSFGCRLLRNPARLFDRDHAVAALNGAQRLKYRAPLGYSPEHAHARRVSAAYPEAWRSYFKFCFVRNPFDRAVSDYIWRTRKKENAVMTFREFLDQLSRRDFTSSTIPRHFDNWPIYTIDNRIAVDFIGRFERLEEDLARVFEFLGLDRRILVHAKSMPRQKRYQDWYGDPERSLVERLFANELREFEYRF